MKSKFFFLCCEQKFQEEHARNWLPSCATTKAYASTVRYFFVNWFSWFLNWKITPSYLRKRDTIKRKVVWNYKADNTIYLTLPFGAWLLSGSITVSWKTDFSSDSRSRPPEINLGEDKTFFGIFFQFVTLNVLLTKKKIFVLDLKKNIF